MTTGELTYRIGWIKPDDGERDNGRLLSYECFRVERWLHDHGFRSCVVDIELLRAEPLHTPEHLAVTGDFTRLAPCVVRLAKREADVVAWVCTSGSFVGGRAWAEAQRDVMAKAAGGRPVVTTSLAIVQVLQAHRINQIDLLSPYPAPLTDRLVKFLDSYGIAVGHLSMLDCPTGGDSHRLDPEEQIEAFSATAESSAILLPDTAIDTLDLGATLESIAGRPVLTANQISVWSILRCLGREVRMPRCGSLLAGTLSTAL